MFTSGSIKMKFPFLRALLFGLAVTLVLIVNPCPGRAGGDDEGLKLIGAISVPGNPLAVDISYVDQRRERYYLADVSNKGVDVFDSEGGFFLGRISGNFHGLPPAPEIAKCGPPGLGFDARGPSGVLVANDNRLWVTDYTGTNGVVKVFELEGAEPPFTLVTPSATINFDGSEAGSTQSSGCRADEEAFDPDDHIVIVGFPEPESGGTPFVALISSDPPYNILGTISFSGAGGMEQSAWDPKLHRFLVNVPSGKSFVGEIAVINPLNPTVVENSYPTNCGGAGLAIGPLQHLLVGCSDAADLIMDATNGNILTTLDSTKVANSDEVWFNRGDNNFYATSNFTSPAPALAVIDAETDTFRQDVPTAFGSHSVAAFRENNHVFVPIQKPVGTNPDVCNSTFGLAAGQGCIFVYANENDEGEDGGHIERGQGERHQSECDDELHHLEGDNND